MNSSTPSATENPNYGHTPSSLAIVAGLFPAFILLLMLFWLCPKLSGWMKKRRELKSGMDTRLHDILMSKSPFCIHLHTQLLSYHEPVYCYIRVLIFPFSFLPVRRTYHIYTQNNSTILALFRLLGSLIIRRLECY